jgi:hypothetical protein
MIDSVERLEFRNVRNSILFYMGKNVPSLNDDEALEFLRTADNPYLITTDADYDALQDRAGVELEVLLKSDYLIKEKARYVLLRKKIPSTSNPSVSGALKLPSPGVVEKNVAASR